MERSDRDLIHFMMESDMELARLYQRHEQIEDRLDDYSSRLFLTSDEEMEVKRLKKEKLIGVDRMMLIINAYRSNSESHAAW